jgi:hypothetical protein
MSVPDGSIREDTLRVLVQWPGRDQRRNLPLMKLVFDRYPSPVAASTESSGICEPSARQAATRSERARRRRQDAEQAYRDEVYRQWLAAEAATNGFMLNQAGRRSGIDERSLFGGPESRVRKYASPELIEWFQSHPRPTRVSWFGSASARRAHRAGRRIG